MKRPSFAAVHRLIVEVVALILLLLGAGKLIAVEIAALFR